MSKSVYILCVVRKATDEDKKMLERHVAILEEAGNEVFYPARDNPHEGVDETGSSISLTNLAALEAADEVHIFWDSESRDSVLELGMCFALHKPVVLWAMDVSKEHAKVSPSIETIITDWNWGFRDRREK